MAKQMKMNIEKIVRNIVKSLLLTTLLIGGVSCGDDESDEIVTVFVDHLAMEKIVLGNWMENYASDAVLQEEGYYIDEIVNPPTEALTVPCWVRYNITSYNTVYEVCNTRYENRAYEQGTFNFHTHYVPALQYISSGSTSDALSIAIENGLVGLDSSFTLYMPSSLRGDTPNGTAGYSGQNQLLEGRPMISEVTITEVIETGAFNDYQKDYVRGFKDGNVLYGTWTQGGDDDSSSDCLYYTNDYLPENDALTFDFTTDEGRTNSTYVATTTDPSIDAMVDMADKNSAIELALLDEEMFTIAEEDVVIGTTNAYVWYVARLLDGFVVDSNIPAVRDIMGWTSDSTDVTPIVYTTDYRDNYITAWSYSIPYLNFEKWALVVTSSVDAYGYYGTSGSTYTSEIQPYTPMVFQIYVSTSYYNDDDE